MWTRKIIDNFAMTSFFWKTEKKMKNEKMKRKRTNSIENNFLLTYFGIAHL